MGDGAKSNIGGCRVSQAQLETPTANAAADLLERVESLLPELREEAAACDVMGAAPLAGLQHLRAAGLLLATVPSSLGGCGMYGAAGAQNLLRLLHLLGESHMALGRLFEAHVNALELVRRYGSPRQLGAAAEAAHAGELFALWVTDPVGKHSDRRLRLEGGVLSGEKWFCSAAGVADRALVTAETDRGAQMLFVAVNAACVTDQGVKLAGMRAAKTGSVDLTGIAGDNEVCIGLVGDYLREPAFSTGAWRSSAVALGGLAILVETTRGELLARGRGDQAYQRQRFGQMAIAQETGWLWMQEAAQRAESAGEPGEEAVAYVNLARTAVETACLDGIRLVQRSLGLSSCMQGSAAERIARDLQTYLRQPAPDEALAEAAGYCLRHGSTWSMRSEVHV